MIRAGLLPPGHGVSGKRVLEGGQTSLRLGRIGSCEQDWASGGECWAIVRTILTETMGGAPEGEGWLRVLGGGFALGVVRSGGGCTVVVAFLVAMVRGGRAPRL